MYEVIENIFPIEWRLSNKIPVPYHGKKVFGTFVCGGGSTMGYKLAGYEHLGGVEFLKDYADIYELNHHPKYLFIEDIRNFNNRNDLPDELYNLDILDGSPPCAAFSTAGRREKVWGKQSLYNNEVMQRKDDLVFVYADTIKKLKPKIFLLENVSGFMKGNAKAYVRTVIQYLSELYNIQIFLLDAATMGCPQMRLRTFIIGGRKDYDFPKLKMNFNCPVVPFSVTKKYWDSPENESLSIKDTAIYKYWQETNIGESHYKHFSMVRPALSLPCPTITQGGYSCKSLAAVCHPLQPRKLNTEELRLISTFPLDYNFGLCNPGNVMGRSVLPVMMANISREIYLQWLKEI